MKARIKRTIKLTALLFIAVILSVSLFGCTNKDSGTYYPDNTEMKTNLENVGYTVTVTTDLADKSGVYLSATKGYEYIEFYWLDNASDCEYFYNILEENHTDYDSLVEITHDNKFGNIVYCGTEGAVNAAGIKVVVVKVKV